MGVGTQQGLAGDAEPFQMHLMADPVARTGEHHAPAGSHGLQVKVVVPVFRTVLHHIVVNVGNGKFGGDFFHAHRFQFQICHSAGGVLRQSLVDLDRHGSAGNCFTGNHMFCEDLLNNGILCHVADSLYLL